MEEFIITVPKYSEVEISEFNSNDAFMEAYVELLKQTIELLYRVVGLRYFDEDGIPQIIDKDEAVIGGNMTRLIKLNVSFLQNVCERKLEICNIISRCIAETYVNIKYILIEGEERVKRNYIKNSLITEKELWDTILSNIRENDGEVLPIEDRMQKSIQESFEVSDFDVEEVKRSSKWKSIKSRSDKVAGEMFYSVYYGISSHSVHGNWQDILSHNLNKEKDGFTLNLDWKSSKPQSIDGPIGLNLDVLKIFNDKELSNYIPHDILKESLKNLTKYHGCLIESHEQWISK